MTKTCTFSGYKVSYAFNGAAPPPSADAPVFGAREYAPEGNCWSYAIDLPEREYLHPGMLSGMPKDGRFENKWYSRLMRGKDYHRKYMPAYEEYCRQGAIRDGLLPVGGDVSKAVVPEGYYLVAMAVRCCVTYPDGTTGRDRDYHWYRQDQGGLWSQRRGTYGAVTNLDYSGDLITDPRTMHRGDYERFSGFFLAKRGMGQQP